ncbi:hypothetical protein EBU99_14945 [bacterium]|nr:hypothetical protein [bacterium]
MLPAAPLGVPNAVAFAPLGYAVRFRLGGNAHAFLPIQKLTTHYATCGNPTLRHTCRTAQDYSISHQLFTRGGITAVVLHINTVVPYLCGTEEIKSNIFSESE